MNLEDIIPIEEVAKRLFKSPRTIRFYVSQGWLPDKRVGHMLVFRWSEVVKAIDSKKLGSKRRPKRSGTRRRNRRSRRGL